MISESRKRPVSLWQNLKNFGEFSLYFLWDNFFVLGLIGFFIYWTFFNGRMNWALTVLLIAFALMVAARFLSRYRQNLIARSIYRTLVLFSAALPLTALCIQTVRFIFVFLPGLSEPTLPKILVRIGIGTTVIYAYSLVAALAYYLYTHDMFKIIWNGSPESILNSSFKPYQPQNWQRVRFSSLLMVKTIFWGGAVCILTLGVGLMAWLLR